MTDVPDIKNQLTRVVDRIDTLYQCGGSIAGIATGIRPFDSMCSGLHYSELSVFAGRPSAGKSTLAINLALHAVVGQKIPTVIFAFSLKAEQIVTRMLSTAGCICLDRLQNGNLDDDDWARLSGAVQKISCAQVFIDDTNVSSLEDMEIHVKNHVNEHGVGLIIIDDLQTLLFRCNISGSDIAIAAVVHLLKSLAIELNLPVVLFSQLRPDLEYRENKRPRLSDLINAEIIEQAADMVTFIYREELYDEHSTQSGLAELIVAKQNHGPLGTCHLTFSGRYASFRDSS